VQPPVRCGDPRLLFSPYETDWKPNEPLVGHQSHGTDGNGSSQSPPAREFRLQVSVLPALGAGRGGQYLGHAPTRSVMQLLVSATISRLCSKQSTLTASVV
jgi:hypothetical protein